MKQFPRIWALLLLLTLCLSAFTGCNTPDGGGTDTTVGETTEGDTPKTDAETTSPVTESAEPALVLDANSHVLIPAEADDITRKTADRVVAIIKEITSLELTVTEDTSAAGIALGLDDFDGERCYAVSVQGNTLRLDASDPTTLWYAAEAVLTAWLSTDFGLMTEGVITLPESRVGELNGLATKLDTSIRVLSQNMRGNDDPDGNTVQNRSKRFMQLMKEYRPDLFGAQEYTSNWNTWLTKHTKKAGGTGVLDGYEMVGCSRNGPDSTGGEFNPIFYRTDRFELLDSNTFWLSDTPDIPSKIDISTDKRICTWALLKDKLTGETILFANTHLDHSTDVARSAQAEYLMNFLTEYIGEYPIYLTGDFNCNSYSVPYSIVTAKLTDAQKSTWKDASTVDHTFHDYGNYFSHIDFIFHTSEPTCVAFEIISKSYDGYVADHYGLFAEFVLD